MAERYKDPDWLRKKYVSEDKSQQEIADECDVTQTTISRTLNRLGIEQDRRYQDEEWLRTKYVDEGLSSREIESLCDVSYKAIRYWLEQNGIERRPPGGQPVGDKPISQGFYNSAEWQQVKRKAQARDDETCQECDEENLDEIHVHHVEPMSQGGAKLNLDNLVTLCRDCHYSKH